MIRIVCDFEGVEHIQADVTLDSPGDYIAGRQAIYRALNQHSEQTLTVLVRSNVVAKWLDDLREYGPHVVDFQTSSVRQRFKDRFGVVMPSTLTNALVTEFGLLEWPESRINPNNIEGSILAHVLSDVWTPDVPTGAHWREFIHWTLHTAQPTIQLVDLMRLKLERWQAANPKYLVFDSIHSLQDKAIVLVASWCLRSYPGDFLQALGLNRVQDLPIDDADCMEALNLYKQAIDQYWRQRFSEIDDATDALHEALQVMSGLSDNELGELVEHVERNPELCTPDVLRAIQNKFAELETIEEASNRLKSITPPLIPLLPEMDFTIDEMLAWARDKYIPYFTWIVRAEKNRTEQIQLANQFAEWLYTHYKECVFSAGSPFVAQQLHRFKEVVSLKRMALWVIVDGLTWWEGIHLTKLAEDEFQLSVPQIWPQIAALPSITSISKRAMVRGYMDTEDPEVSNVQVAAEEIKKRYGATSTASTQFKTIQSAIQQGNGGLYLWFYNELDADHHKSEEFREDVVAGHLRQVLRGISTIAQKCKKQGLALSIFVSSDHGCTRLPDDAQRRALPKFADQWTAEEPELDISATRACSIRESVSPTAFDSLVKDWYVLQKDIFHLPFDFVVPKGYDYVGRRPKGWTHGGLSPEEVVVPFIQLQAAPLEILRANVRFNGSVRTNFVSLITIEITNTNDFELRNVVLSFHWTESRVIEFGTIPAKKQLAQQIELAARTIEGNKLTLECFLSYDIHGQERNQKDRVTLDIRRLMTATNAIDDMFS